MSSPEGGHHDAHAADHGGDHGHEKKESLLTKISKLRKIVGISALLLFAFNDIAKPMTIDPIKNTVETGMGFAGKAGHAKSHDHHVAH